MKAQHRLAGRLGRKDRSFEEAGLKKRWWEDFEGIIEKCSTGIS